MAGKAASYSSTLYNVQIAVFASSPATLEKLVEPRVPDSLYKLLLKGDFFEPKGDGHCTGALQNENYVALCCIWVNTDHTREQQRLILEHEVLHATFNLLDARGLELCDRSSEAFTYFFGEAMKTLTTSLKLTVASGKSAPPRKSKSRGKAAPARRKRRQQRSRGAAYSAA
jgi:hypothetical protein